MIGSKWMLLANHRSNRDKDLLKKREQHNLLSYFYTFRFRLENQNMYFYPFIEIKRRVVRLFSMHRFNAPQGKITPNRHSIALILRMECAKRATS